MLGDRLWLWLAFTGCLVQLGCGASADQPDHRARGRGSAGAAPDANGGSGIGLLPGSNPVDPGLSPGSPGAAPSGPIGAGKVCASAILQTAKNDPTIVFVIDGSGSMCAPFGGGGTRWQAVRKALLDPMTGLIYRLQSSVAFGATLYDGTLDLTLALGGFMGGGSQAQNPQCALSYAQNKNMGMCPQLIETPPKKGNAMALDAAFPMTELGGSTPTDRALGHVMDGLIATRRQQGPDQQAQSPVYVILATDGAPNDICVGGVGGDGAAQRQGVIAAVDRGAAAGITTWVISLADGDAMLQAHLDEVAIHGEPKNPAAHTFTPSNGDALVMTLAQLLGGAIGCHINLNGKVTVGKECLGTVQLNGQSLDCCRGDASGASTCANMPVAAANGWRLSDPSSIELVGAACTNFLVGSGDLLNASFPCEVFTPD